MIRKGIALDKEALQTCLGYIDVLGEAKLAGGTSVRTTTWKTDNFIAQIVDCDLGRQSGCDPKRCHVDTPFAGTNNVDPDGGEETGVLSSVAACVLKKTLRAARYARNDFPKAIASLACNLTKWTRNCDKQLSRLISYVACTKIRS